MKILVSIGLISAIVVFGVIFYKYFVIENIECYSQFDKCDDQFSTQLALILPIRYVKLNSRLKDILQNNPEIYKYSYQLKLPNKIRLDVVVRRPIFALKSEKVNSSSLIDQYGKVVGISESTMLPSMFIEGRLPNVGEQVSEETLSQVAIVQGIYKTVNVEKTVVKGNDIYISATNTPQIIVPTGKDHELLLGSVGLVLSRLKHILEETKIDMSGISRIDFRYKDPIIVKV